ncbi:MAG TPA: hypothetical protein VNO30_32445 [Kofleriaceae bacterium]|nr:hypothetical protein [Kofleriaceae bacterium]
MMKTDVRLALLARQRRFEWALAHDAQARTAATFVRGKTHDLLNLLQIIRLSASVLEQRCDAAVREIIVDLQRSADESHRSLTELIEIARPPEVAARGAPVAEAVRAAVASLEGGASVRARIEARPEAVTRCTAEEIDHLVLGLVLDVAETRGSEPPVEILVRERMISSTPWIEIVRGSEAVPVSDRFELRVVEAIAHRASGELVRSEQRGGEEVIVALPQVGAR